MSSSGSRGSGGPPSNRYPDRNEYTEYGKSRRKNFYSPNASRRDYKSSGPGSSSLTHSGPPGPHSGSHSGPHSGPHVSGSHNSAPHPRKEDSSRSYTNPAPARDRNSYSQGGSYSISSKGSSYGSYYPSYGSYNSFSGGNSGIANGSKGDSASFYGSRSDNWRSDRAKSGDSRLSTSNKPSLSTSYSRPAPTSTDYRYDSYGEPVPSGSLNNISNKWKYNTSTSSAQSLSNPYNANRMPVASRNSLTGSVGSRYSAKDRIRGSSFGSSSSLVNTGAKRTTSGDTYYPNRSYSSGYQSAKTVDRYSTNKPTNRYSKPEDHKSRSQSAELDDNELIEAKTESKEFSPGPDYDDDDDDSRLEMNTTKEASEDENNEEEENEDDDEEEISVETKPIPEAKPAPVYEKVDVSNEECYADGCIYPKTQLETSFEGLQQEFLEKTKHDDGSNYLKYSLAKPITDLNEHSFILKNYQRYFQSKDQLIDRLKDRNAMINRKRISLWKEYSKGLEVWKKESKMMDQQLRILHPPDDEMRREIDSSDTKKHQYVQTPLEPGSPEQPQAAPPGARRGRRHGDLVTTEAEFQEILKSLGKELDEDPLIKAQRVSAPIPDLILDPIQRNYVKFMDANNIVNDREEWTKRVRTDFINNFSPKEHELFCEAFCLYPKRFGAISRHMGGLRNPRECVVHYYITKKAVNYKQLLAQHKKKAAKKVARRPKPIKSRNVSQSQTPVSTPSIETATMEVDGYTDVKPDVQVPLLTTEPFSEELFTDTGRRKRAAAPVFEGKPPKKEEEDKAQPPKKKARKKKDELSSDALNTSPTNGHVEPVEKIDENVNTDVAVENGEPLAEEIVRVPEETVAKIEVSDTDHDKERKKAISSYWSITEANLFPSLLKEHGTKWTTIADKLTTKTATMVRNYYQRNAEKNDWTKVAGEADERLEAKFAAVLSTNPDDEEKPETVEQPNVPIGTFHHANGVPANYGVTKPTISSLLSPTVESGDPIQHTATEPQPEPEQEQEPPVNPQMATFSAPSSVVPQRTSIMSLLNSDSPVKTAPPFIMPHRKKSLHDLLNSPSAEQPVIESVGATSLSNDPGTK